MLRKIRITLAAICFALITLLLLDFTGTLHTWFGWLARIQFLPAVLALNVAVVAFLVVLTLLLGRVYCSVICPLGVFQDIVSWLSGRRKKHRYRFSYSPAKRWLRIAVLALNPHAGDGGLLGREEEETIRPAIVEAFNKGILAFGPFAADGLFAGGGYARYDGILAMYHDQGLAPFKSLSPDGVNFTAGLTAVRTSPDHGTAFDIAGQDRADAQSMRNAIYTAIDVVQRRRAWAEWTRNPLPRAEREKSSRDISLKELPQTEKE